MRFVLLALALTACAVTPAPTAVTAPGPSIVRNSTEAGPDVQAAAYVRLVNGADQPDRLVRVTCACADEVQIHSTHDSAMHTLPHLDIPANGALDIVPGGPTHLMLMGVREVIEPGQSVTMTLHFAHTPAISTGFEAVENSREGWAARLPR